jgi:tetratricopeptide (TPR) repeat protein
MKKPLLLFILCTIVNISFSQSQTDSLQSMLPVLQGKEKLEVLKKLTHTYLMQSYDSCIYYGLQTIELAKELDDLKAEGYAERRTGYAYFQSGNYNESITHYKRGLLIYQELQNTLNVGIMADLLSRTYKQVGEYESSLEYFIQGEKTGNLMKMDTSVSSKKLYKFFSILYVNGGLLYFQLDSINKAIYLFEQSLDFASEINDSTRIAAAYSNIGMVYEWEQKYDQAMEYYKKGLFIARKTGNRRYEASVLMNISNIFRSQNMIDSSMFYSGISLSISKQTGNKSSLALVYHNRALCFVIDANYYEAIKILHKSLNISKEIDAKRITILNYKSLSKVWDSIPNSDSAYYYYKLYAQLNDIVTGEETSKKIVESQIKYETEKKAQENLILKQDATINKKVKQSLYTIIAALLLFSILILYLFRLKSKTLKQKDLLFLKEKEINRLALVNNEVEKNQLEDQLFAEQQINRLQKEKLEQKYRELSTVTLHIINKNEVLTMMLNEMEEHKKTSQSDDINACFNKFTSLIKNNINLNESWEQFKLHFEEVYSGFFESLKTHYPSLTPYDHKLCAYLKMKLSSKEIAQMLNITVAAVDKSRNRLRKKIGIAPEVNLLDFVDEIG